MRHTNRSNGAASQVLLLTTTLLCLVISCLSPVQANINCAQPTGGSYKAVDIISLNWGDDGAKPTVNDIISMQGTLVCNEGNKIADIPITTPKFVGPANWTIPSVGNATTVGGTVGACAGNAFHIQYSGEYMGGIFGVIKTDWGPVRCGTMTIAPSPNGTVTTTSAMPTSTTTTTTTTKSKTSSTSSTASPSASPDESSSGGGGNKTTIIVASIVAGAVLILFFAGFMWHIRRQKLKRMEEAIMPWSNQPKNKFSKMSASMDEGPRSSDHLPGAAAGGGGAAGAAATTNYFNKAQPAIPPPSHGTNAGGGGGGYYDNERHNYQQGYGNNSGQGGYDGYSQEEDNYYNPYYATQHQQGNGHGQGYDYYASSNASATPGHMTRSPYQDSYQQPSHDPFQHHQVQHQPTAVSSSGYYPPPPPVNNNAPGGGAFSPPSVPISPVPVNSSTTLISSSTSPKRAPQTILPEMGSPAAGDDYPMKEISLTTRS
ncbi:hypothetical protein BGZ94_000157 [Podila epigama]|nr:hypothetical protein BGZ94_000157 [Podila epigama]